MSAFAVSMPVGDLFSGSVPDPHDFNIEYEIFTGQGMISIKFHGLTEHFDHAEQQDFALRSVCLELIAFLEVFSGRELVFRNFNHQLIIEVSIGISSGNLDFPFVSNSQQSHGALEPGNDLPHAFEVSKGRLGITRGINHLARRIRESIMEGNDALRC